MTDRAISTSAGIEDWVNSFNRLDSDVGALIGLPTADKSSLVAALIEINAGVDSNNSALGILGSSTVRLTGAQTVAGIKTFTDTMRINNTAPQIAFIDTTRPSTHAIIANNNALQYSVDPSNADSNSFHQWNIDGVEQLRLSTTGLGVGRTAAVPLDVQTTGLGVRVINPSGGTSYMRFDNNTADTPYIGHIGGAMSMGNTGAFPLRFVTNSVERMRVDASGNFGIGTADPKEKLHVVSSTLGVATVANDNYDEAVFENKGAAGITILSPSTTVGGIAFGDSANRSVGLIAYNHALDALQIHTSGSEKVRLTNAGRLGLNNTNPNRTLNILGVGTEQIVAHVAGGSSTRTQLTLANSTTTSDAHVGVAANADKLELIAGGAVRATVEGNKLAVGSTSAPTVALDVTGTDAIKVPAGSTAQRPTAAAGLIRYNSTVGEFEGYSTQWNPIGKSINRVGDSINLTGLSSYDITDLPEGIEEIVLTWRAARLSSVTNTNHGFLVQMGAVGGSIQTTGYFSADANAGTTAFWAGAYRATTEFASGTMWIRRHNNAGTEWVATMQSLRGDPGNYVLTDDGVGVVTLGDRPDKIRFLTTPVRTISAGTLNLSWTK